MIVWHRPDDDVVRFDISLFQSQIVLACQLVLHLIFEYSDIYSSIAKGTTDPRVKFISQNLD